MNDLETTKMDRLIIEVGERSSRMDQALKIARELRTHETRIDGWCSSCQEIDEHRDWCPWMRLVGLLDDNAYSKQGGSDDAH